MFIKLPSLKTYCPTAYFIQFVFSFSSLQTKFGKILKISAYL